jgi:hypothetical protein
LWRKWIKLTRLLKNANKTFQKYLKIYKENTGIEADFKSAES